MQKTVIELHQIKKSFKIGEVEVHALRGIDLLINRGEYVALMGPSGSGKSTLMNIIGCLDTPTSGSYNLNNTDVSHLSDNQLAEIRNKEIGFVFQTFNLLARNSALDNVALPLVYAGFSKKERKEKAITSLLSVGLSDRMDHKPNELSGYRQHETLFQRPDVR